MSPLITPWKRRIKFIEDIPLIHCQGDIVDAIPATLELSSPLLPVDEKANILIYENLRTGETADMTIQGANWEAQTFTPAVSHVLTKVSIKCRRVGDCGNVILGIRQTSGGLPSGNDIESVTIPQGMITPGTASGWIIVTFQGVSLSNGVTYALVVRAPSGDASNYFIWRVNASSPPYTGGQRCFSTNSGSSWTADSTRDYMFEEGI